MSRIDELIKDLCPDGVEYLAVSELFDLRNGYTPSKSNSTFWEDGSVPWFRMEDIRENGRILDNSLQKISDSAVKGGKLFPANSILVATSATIGEHALITVPHLSNQRFTSLSLKPAFSSRLTMKFAYYYGFVLGEWCRKNTTTSSFASVDMVGFKRFKFPVPPLEVQRVIVDILDQFVKLEARKQQYEYYRGQILSFVDSAEWQTIGECLDLKAGRSIKAAEISPIASAERGVRCFGGNGVRGFVAIGSHHGSYPLIGRQGALCGNVNWVEGEFYATEHAVVAVPKAGIDSRWVYHMLTEMNLNQYATKSAQPGLSVSRLNQVRIPVPSLMEQQEAASLLDAFDALVNDLSSGLPAEIAARRKQYEYYRDKLLTFKELAS